MVSVVVKYWRSNHQGGPRPHHCFWWYWEKDAHATELLFIGCAVAARCLAGYLVLYPRAWWVGRLSRLATGDDKQLSTTLDKRFCTNKRNHIRRPRSCSSYHVNSGRILFQTHCAACHRDNGQGAKALPNPIDQEWLYGGSVDHYSLDCPKERNGAMPGWSEIMRQMRWQKSLFYLASLNQRHTDVPEVKVELGKSLFVQYCSRLATLMAQLPAKRLAYLIFPMTLGSMEAALEDSTYD